MERKPLMLRLLSNTPIQQMSARRIIDQAGADLDLAAQQGLNRADRDTGVSVPSPSFTQHSALDGRRMASKADRRKDLTIQGINEELTRAVSTGVQGNPGSSSHPTAVRSRILQRGSPSYAGSRDLHGRNKHFFEPQIWRPAADFETRRRPNVFRLKINEISEVAREEESDAQQPDLGLISSRSAIRLTRDKSRPVPPGDSRPSHRGSSPVSRESKELTSQQLGRTGSSPVNLQNRQSLNTAKKTLAVQG